MKLGFLGCGNMGQAILSAVVKKKVVPPKTILVANQESEKNKIIAKKYSVQTTLKTKDLEKCDVVILGIKPQQLNDLKFTPRKNSILISILAGTPGKKLQKKFPSSRIVRTMPNLGQFVGMGMTGVFFGGKFSAEEKKLVRQIFKSGGEILELKKESELDAITAISGSGPAYFFQFCESLVQAATKLRFGKKEAESLVRQTFFGAAEIVKKNPNDSFELWRKKVTSPGGTTEAATKIFEKGKITNLVKNATTAAWKKAQELGKK